MQATSKKSNISATPTRLHQQNEFALCYAKNAAPNSVRQKGQRGAEGGVLPHLQCCTLRNFWQGGKKSTRNEKNEISREA